MAEEITGKEQNWKAAGQLFSFSSVWTEQSANWGSAQPSPPHILLLSETTHVT